MKFKALFIACIGAILFASSCIKEEAPYREADITIFTFKEALTTHPISTTSSGGSVQIIIKADADITNLQPIVELSSGATISPDINKPQDFTNDVIYTVTSEDKQNTKKFTVRVSDVITIKSGFDEWKSTGAPATVDGSWKNANTGVLLAGGTKDKMYPTRPSDPTKLDEAPYAGERAAVMETKEYNKTVWGNYISIFAGNLFRGVFLIDIKTPIKSAKFGLPHPKEFGKPHKFTGYYKYKPGEIFLDKEGKVVEGEVDEFDIYAIVFKVDKNATSNDDLYLNGSNVNTSDRVIARAILEDRTPKEKYTSFSLNFLYTEAMDYDRYDYRLAVVMSSSREGDLYRGAPGSKLIVDEIEVISTVYK